MSPARAKARLCPACGGQRVARIVYGRIVRSPALDAALERGEITVGGCDVDDGDPEWECLSCRTRWGGKGQAPWPAKS